MCWNLETSLKLKELINTPTRLLGKKSSSYIAKQSSERKRIISLNVGWEPGSNGK